MSFVDAGVLATAGALTTTVARATYVVAWTDNAGHVQQLVVNNEQILVILQVLLANGVSTMTVGSNAT